MILLSPFYVGSFPRGVVTFIDQIQDFIYGKSSHVTTYVQVYVSLPPSLPPSLPISLSLSLSLPLSLSLSLSLSLVQGAHSLEQQGVGFLLGF